MPMFSLVLKTMKSSDWVCLLAVSLCVSTCGVFGVSYVAGRGWAILPLWAEVALSLSLGVLVAVAFIWIDAGISRLLGLLPKPVAVQKKRGATCGKHANQQSVQNAYEDSSGKEVPTKTKTLRGIFARITPQWTFRSIAIFSLIMLVCWMPWYVANFPGGTYWDTYYQIYQVYPENHPIAVIPWAEIYDQTLTDAWLVDHHPVFTTLVYGAFGWVSDQLTGNWMAGVALFCFLQGAAHVVAFTASVAYLRKIGCPAALAFAAYAYFALAPFISTWAMCMVKDSFFGLLYVPYFMLLFETVRTRGAVLERRRNVVLFVLCALGLCLTKKTGMFVVIPTALLGMIVFRKRSRKPAGFDEAAQPHKTARPRNAFLLQGAVCAAVMLVLFPLVLFPALNIEAGGKQEVLGPLFQQTARYVLDWGDQIPPEERDAIAAVIDYDKLAEQYEFDFEDSVKYRFNLDATNEDIARYLAVYVKEGLRHPESYLAAAASLAGFYVAPCAYINIRMVTVDTKMGPDQRYMLWNPDELDGLRNGLDEAYKAVAHIPGIDIPLLIVTYAFWLPAALVYLAFRHRLKSALLFIPPLVLLAFCIIAPVYDARYVVPILDAAPLFFCGVMVLLQGTRGTISTHSRPERI